MEKRTKGVYVPIGGKKLLTFMDDFNMPAKDTFGSQPPLELIRLWLDYGFWYDRQKQTQKYIKVGFWMKNKMPYKYTLLLGICNPVVEANFVRNASHCDNLPMQFNSIFHGSMKSFFQMKISDIFLICGPNIDCGCSLESLNQVVLTSTNNLFWAKIICTPLQTQHFPI